MTTYKDLSDRAIEVLNRHIVPDGISDKEALLELYGIFDGPDYRALLAQRAKPVTGSIDTPEFIRLLSAYRSARAEITKTKRAELVAYIDAQRAPQATEEKPYGYCWYTEHMEQRFTHSLPLACHKVIGEPKAVYERPQAAEQVVAGDSLQFRNSIEAAWCAGYYHAGYTHDSAYAIQEAEKFADAILNAKEQA